MSTKILCAKCLNVERWEQPIVACCSWTCSTDEYFLERNASATKCSWTVGQVTALTVFHYFTSVVTSMCKHSKHIIPCSYACYCLAGVISFETVKCIGRQPPILLWKQSLIKCLVIDLSVFFGISIFLKMNNLVTNCRRVFA